MVNNYDHKYYKKYIKYKNKYLQYKRILYGGTQPPQPQPSQPPLSVIVLASHQNAIGEFLSVLVTNYAKTRKKIKNCACLEISKVGKDVKVRMIYKGELDPKDTSKKQEHYFTIKKFNNQNYKFKNEYVEKIGDNVKILLVRHGNGPHNSQTGIMGGIVKIRDEETYTDPLLTPLGIKQAERASNSIISKIKSYRGQCTIHLGSSRLRRAIQTAGIIGYHILQTNIPNVSMELRVIIIPGVEEIFDSTGNSENTILSIGLNPENRSICPIGSNMPKNCDNLYLTTTPTTAIDKIDFYAFKEFIESNNSAYIPVDFSHMLQYKKPIFPFSKRIETAFDVLKKVSETQQMPQTPETPQTPNTVYPFRVVGGSNKNKHT
jgi:hypothetical protein